jgi:hypothetical protein
VKSLLVLLTLGALLSSCVHNVKGDLMTIKIKRVPTCKVTVDMDGKLVFEGTGTKPCPKE